jgi:hypothetical protein
VRRASQFEKSNSGAEDEKNTAPRPIDRKQSSEALKVGVIRKRASEEHNRLRQMFEEGQAFGRSVSPNFLTNTTLKDPSLNSNDGKHFIEKQEAKADLYAEPLAQSQLQHTKDKDLSEVEADEQKEMTSERVGGVIEALGEQGSKLTKEVSSSTGSSLGKESENESINGPPDPFTSSNKHGGISVKRSSSLLRSSIPELKPVSSFTDGSPRVSSPNPKRSGSKRSMIPKLSAKIGFFSPTRRPSLTPTSSILSPAITTTSASNHTVVGASMSPTSEQENGIPTGNSNRGN